MNTNHRTQSGIARKVSVRRRFGVSMPTAPSDVLRRHGMRRPAQALRRRDDRFRDEYQARLAAMPPDFLDWLEDVPVWPENAQERLGETTGGS